MAEKGGHYVDIGGSGFCGLQAGATRQIALPPTRTAHAIIREKAGG